MCNHEWTFLEGHKSHSHTLKAGRHLFPFELRVGGSLPSSVATLVNGGSSVSYKLRATVIRSGFSANLTAIQPITLTRTFAPESLEYQQTLEIENTWPEKLMYALIVPHKAWAAGDELTSLVKFAPLAKGVRVISITSNLCETTRTLAKGGHLEKTRVVVSRRHEIVRGRAVSVDAQEKFKLHQLLQNTLAGSSSAGSRLGPSMTAHSGPQSGSASPFFMHNAGSAVASGISTPLGDGGIPLSRQSFATTSSSTSSSSEDVTPSFPTQDGLNFEDEDHDFESEITTTISIPLPPSLTPSHPLDPIIVSYRIRWSILLSNLDGHTSELRCSLPVHILDYSLLDEARKASSITRRLLLGGPDAEPDAAEEDAQLPSYPSHVRDRVPLSVAAPEAQAFLPYAYVLDSSHDSGTCTPMESGFLHSHSHSQSYPSNLSSLASGSSLRLHPQPGSGSGSESASGSNSSSPSMGTVELPSIAPSSHPSGSRNMTAPSPLAHEPGSRPASRHGRDRTGERDIDRERERDSGRATRWFPLSRSRVNSRAGSRAASPERISHSSSSNVLGSENPSSGPSVASAFDTHVHSNTPATRQQHGVFSAMMKPLTGLSAQFAHSHSHAMALTNTISHHSPPSASNLHGTHMGRAVTVGGIPSRSRTPENNWPVFAYSPEQHSLSNSPSASSGQLHALSSHYRSQSTASLAYPSPDASAAAAAALLQRAFTLVPDYTTASRSGSAAPLESLQGLPTYEDSEAHIHGAPWRSTPPLPQISASASRA